MRARSWQSLYRIDHYLGKELVQKCAPACCVLQRCKASPQKLHTD
jgi:hypothetical protein